MKPILYNLDQRFSGHCNYHRLRLFTKMKHDLILCGEASIDEFSFQIGPRLALSRWNLCWHMQGNGAKDNEVVVEKKSQRK